MHYDALMADPVSTVRDLYHSVGDEVSDEHAWRMTALLRDRPKDAFGRHRYDPADFGWTYAEASEANIRQYDVQPEKPGTPGEAGPAD